MNVTTLKVLLVGMSLPQARLIRETLLSAAPRSYEVAHAHRLVDASKLLARTRFDAVLLETPIPDARPAEALARIRAAGPTAGVVVLVRPVDVAHGSEAVSRGACTYIVKDQLWELDTPRLVRAIDVARQASVAPSLPPARSETPGRDGRVIGFIGARGGVGTTSLCLRMARWVASTGRRAVLVELRTWPGTLAMLAGVDAQRHLGRLAQLGLETNASKFLDEILVTVEKDLKVLVAPPAPVAELTPERVAWLIRGLSKVADVVVLDLPGDASPAVRKAIELASFVGVVVESEPACLRQARSVLSLLKSWSVGAARYGVLVIYRTPSLDSTLEELAGSLGAEIIGSIPVPPGMRIAVPAQQEASGPVLSGDALSLSLEDMFRRLGHEDVRPIPV